MVSIMQDYRTQLREGGRIIIPALLRKELNLEIGEEVILRLEKDGLHLVTLKAAVLKAQTLVQKYNKSQQTLTEELFKMRQEEHD